MLDGGEEENRKSTEWCNEDLREKSSMRGMFFKAALNLVLTALAVGFVIGALVWVLASILGIGTQLLWYDLRGALNWWFFPLLICVPAGLVIGLMEKRFHTNPRHLFAVIAGIKKDGTYSAGNLGAALFSFMMPLLSGGSIGPAVGLAGVIASCISRVVPRFRSIAQRMGERPVDVAGTEAAVEYRLTKKMSYFIAVLVVTGSVFAIVLLVRLLGWHLFFPRFEFSEFTLKSLAWGSVGLLLSFVLVFMVQLATRVFSSIAAKYPEAIVQKAVACGAVLGLAGIGLPMLLCTGQMQSFELMQSWTLMSCSALFVLGVAKLLITPFCISFGWGGGPFFPVIFGSLSIGYGFAAISGADPIMLAAIFSTAILTSLTKQPVLVVVLILLCFPLESLPFLALSAFLFAKIPLPKCVR